MTLAYVGLGANVGEPRRQLQAALQEISELPGTRITATSGFYRSAPVGCLEQPEFLNAVVELDTQLPPGLLLDSLLAMEIDHGRDRPFPGAPRTLDLDLLLYGDSTIDSSRLTVPHPRMHQRAFVLMPLTEIAPQAAIPGHGKASQLLAGCADQFVQRIG